MSHQQENKSIIIYNGQPMGVCIHFNTLTHVDLSSLINIVFFYFLKPQLIEMKNKIKAHGSDDLWQPFNHTYGCIS